MPTSPSMGASIMRYADFQELPPPPAPRTIAYGRDPLQHVGLWTPEGRARKGDTVAVVTIPAQGHFELITPGTAAGDAVIDPALHLLATRR